MSNIATIMGLQKFNKPGRGLHLRWQTWLGILTTLVLFIAFCLWVFAAVKSTDDGHCQQVAADAEADVQTNDPDDVWSESSTASDNGNICLVKRDAVAR